MNKRFFWFKMSKDFFNDRRIIRLRKLAGGDTFILIYIKMILATLDSSGIYQIDEYEDLYESLSLDLDEDIDNIKITVSFLKKCKLIEEINELTIKFVDVEALTGSETASTIRSRKSRANKKALQCNTDATPLQQIATESKRESIEKDQELEKELNKEKELERKNKTLTHTQTNPILLGTQLHDDEYFILCEQFGSEMVDEKINRSKNYKGCSNFITINEWCKDEVKKQLKNIGAI